MVIRTGGPSSDETAVLDLPGVRAECHAENCKVKHPHKRYCLRGHDTFEVGRISNRTCRECIRERWTSDPEYRERKRERKREWKRERYATDRVVRALWLNAKSRRYLQRAIKRDEALARQLIAKETA